MAPVIVVREVTVTDPDTATALDTLHGLFLAGGCTIEDYLAVRALLVEFSVDEIRECLATHETPATPGGVAGDGRVEQ
jgi:hypothetical protein